MSIAPGDAQSAIRHTQPIAESDLSSPSGGFSFNTPYVYNNTAESFTTPFTAVYSTFNNVVARLNFDQVASSRVVSRVPVPADCVPDSVPSIEVSPPDPLSGDVVDPPLDRSLREIAGSIVAAVFASATEPGAPALSAQSVATPVSSLSGGESTDCDWCVVDSDTMPNTFDATYSGVNLGLEAQDFLHQFERFCGTCVLPGNCQLTKLQVELQNFANAAMPRSRFAQWVNHKLTPILAQIDQAQQQHTAPAARNQAANQIRTQSWVPARKEFEQTFCKGTRAELQTVIAKADFSPGLSGIRQLVIRLQTMYSMNGASALPPQQSAIRMVLYSMSMRPYHFSTAQRLDSALKASGTWTFDRLAEELETLSTEQDDDAAAFMMPSPALQYPHGSSVTPMPFANAALPGMQFGQDFGVSNFASITPAVPAGIEAAKYAKGMSIMCPDQLCTIHGMTHTWVKCPLAQDEADVAEKKPSSRPAKPKVFLSECDVAAGSPSASAAMQNQNEALISRVAGLESTLSQFVSLQLQQHEPTNVMSTVAQDRQANYGSGMYGNNRQASPFNKRPLANCDVCDKVGHGPATCWVAHPELCPGPGALAALASTLPEHLHQMFKFNCRKRNIALPALPQAAGGGDLYPPRPVADEQGRSAYCTIVGETASTFVETVSCQAVEPAEPAAATSMATVSEPEPPADAVSEPEPLADADCCSAMICPCGHPCDCVISSAHESIGQPVWVCPEQSSAACLLSVPAGDSALVQACVAQYAGSLPASFRKADVPVSVFETRAQKQGKARVPPGSSVPAAAQSPAQSNAQPAGSPSAGRVLKGPVSFAADAQPPPTPVVPAAAAAAVAGSSAASPAGWCLFPVGDVSAFLSDFAKQQLCVPPSLSAAVTSVTSSVGESSTCMAVSSSVLSSRPSDLTAAVARKLAADLKSRKPSVLRLRTPPLIKSEGAPDSNFVPARITFIDTCADAAFLTSSFCANSNIRTNTHRESTMHMRTVMGVQPRPHTTTEALHLVVSNGRQSSRLRFNCIVLDGDDSLAYDLILGTPVLLAWAADISFRSSTLTIYPKFVLGDVDAEGIVLDVDVFRVPKSGLPHRAYAAAHKDTSPVSEAVSCVLALYDGFSAAGPVL